MIPKSAAICFRSYAGLTVAGDAHDVVAELLGVGLGHGDILPAAPLGTTDQMSPIRAAVPFDDRQDAVAAALEFAGDAYLSGWIVVRFEPDALTAAERREFAYSLDCINVGVAEGGLEC